MKDEGKEPGGWDIKDGKDLNIFPLSGNEENKDIKKWSGKFYKIFQLLGFGEVYDPETPDDPAGRFDFSKTRDMQEWDFTTVTIGATKIAVVNILNHWDNPILRARIINKLRGRGATDENIENLKETIGKRISLQYQKILPFKYLPVTYRADRNFLNTFPIAVLGKPQPGQTFVSYTNEKAGIKTEAGSMYGVLTEFDFRVFHAIIAFTKRLVIDGRTQAVAIFSQYDIAKYLNLEPGGKGWKRIAEALKKIGALSVTHTIFKTRNKTSVWTNRKVFPDSQIKQKGDEAVNNLFIWNTDSGQNFRDFFEIIDRQILGGLGETPGRLYCYLLRAMGQKGTHREAWESIANRLPLTGKHRPDKKKTFKEACTELKIKAGITWKIDGKDIAYFTSHPKKTKEDHQATPKARPAIKFDEPGLTQTEKEKAKAKVKEWKELEEKIQCQGIGRKNKVKAEPENPAPTLEEWNKRRERILDFLREYGVQEKDLPEISLDPSRHGKDNVGKWASMITGSSRTSRAVDIVLNLIKELERDTPTSYEY